MIYNREKCGLSWVTLPDVQHAFGLINTNCVGLEMIKGMVFYPLMSLISHSCCSNLEPVDNPGRMLTFRAKRRIRKGEELSIRYTSFLAPTKQIQKSLRAGWYFNCKCLRWVMTGMFSRDAPNTWRIFFSCHEVASSGNSNVCYVTCVCVSVSSNSKYLYLPISLSIQLRSLWNLKLKLLCYKPMIQNCMFAIWGDYPMS